MNYRDRYADFLHAEWLHHPLQLCRPICEPTIRRNSKFCGIPVFQNISALLVLAGGRDGDYPDGVAPALGRRPTDVRRLYPRRHDPGPFMSTRYCPLVLRFCCCLFDMFFDRLRRAANCAA